MFYFYLRERKSESFSYKLEYIFVFSNIFKMFEPNLLYNKKKPCVKILFDLFLL